MICLGIYSLIARAVVLFVVLCITSTYMSVCMHTWGVPIRQTKLEILIFQ